MEQSVKTLKRKSKNLVDPGDLVSEKSLEKVYTILGRVSTFINHLMFILIKLSTTFNSRHNKRFIPLPAFPGKKLSMPRWLLSMHRFLTLFLVYIFYE